MTLLHFLTAISPILLGLTVALVIAVIALRSGRERHI
jgi:hypothetical protein